MRSRASWTFPILLALGCSAAAPEPAETDDAAAPPTGNSPDSGAVPSFPELHVMPTTTHSGFDGTHAYRVPVAVYGGKNATLVASDPSLVDIVPTKLAEPANDDGEYFMVTTKKTGTVTLTANAGSSSASASLTIAPYTLEQYSVGEGRYTNAAASGPACVSCHAAAGGIDHSPSRLASAKDTDVVTVITTGILVEGSPITQVKHKWAVSDTEAAGLVAYLRALEPRGFVK